MDVDEKPRVVQTTKIRRRSRRRRIAERFLLVLGVPTLLFVVVALSAGLIEYIPSTTTDIEYKPIAARKFKAPELVDLDFDPHGRRTLKMRPYRWSTGETPR